MADGTHRSRRVQRRQRLSHGFLNYFCNEELVPKPRLELRGMHVHVHRIAGQIEKQEQRRPVTRRDGRAIARLRRSQDEGVANRPAADEYIPLTARGTCLGWSLREPGHFQRPRAMRDREQRIGQLGTPQRMHAIDQARGRRTVEQNATVARERERDVRAREGEHGERLDGGAGLGGGGAQEFPPRWCVVEQAADRDGRAPLAGGPGFTPPPSPRPPEGCAPRLPAPRWFPLST